MRRPLTGAALLLVVALAGCSADPEPDDPTPSVDSASSATTPSASSPSTASTPSESPTEPATPTPSPASGPSLAASYIGEPVLRFRLPAERKWEIMLGGTYAITTLEAADFGEVGGRAFRTVAGKGLAFYAGNTKETTVGVRLERTGTRVVGGIRGYVLEGTGSDGYALYFGAINGDRLAEIFFRFETYDAAAREIIESVLASAEWV